MKKSNMNIWMALHLSACITLIFVFSILCPPYTVLIEREAFGFVNFAPKFVSILYSTGCCFLFSLILFTSGFRISLKHSSSDKGKKNLAIAWWYFLITSIFSIFQMSLYTLLFSRGKVFELLSADMAGFIFLNNASLAVIVASIVVIISLSEKKQQLALQFEALKAENTKIHYMALKNQLNPHFLFNTMSILDSLMEEDTCKAHECIQNFSSVYRYILQNRETVTLEEELAFVHDYFSILKIRYGEDISLKEEIEPEMKRYGTIPMSLQILVENAVKHNIISRQMPLCITIRSTDEYTLEISNRYQPRQVAAAGTGIGLANLSECCKLKCGKDISVKKDDRYFKVVLPLINDKDSNLQL